jgi:two-component system LytT family response regulator
MSQMRALIVDDEPLARSRLRRLLEPHADVQVVGEAADGDGAMRQTMALRPDLIFLDVRMPGASGTEVAQRLRSYLPESVRPAIVFTTAYAEHAVEAFALEGVDYLLKPVDRDRLAEALRRVRRQMWSASSRPAPMTPEPSPEAPAFLTGHHGAALESVPVGSLCSIEVEDGVAWALRVDGERTRLSGTLAEIEDRLPSPPFLRVSRSALVQVERVVLLRPKGSGFEVELQGGARVGVSRRRVRRLEQCMGLEDPT